MRKIIVAALLGLLPVHAVQAQDPLPVETVAVEDHSLAGVWKLTMTRGFKVGMFSKSEWSPLGDIFCRIEDFRGALSVHCRGLRMNSSSINRGSVRVRDGRIRLSWGSGPNGIAVQGPLLSNTRFEGDFTVSGLFLSWTAPEKSRGEKVSLSADAPDKGRKSVLLRRLLGEMANGAPAGTFDPKVAALFPLPETLQALGTIRAVTYVGDHLELDGTNSVYDVEFAESHLICELRQRDDGALEYFECG